MQIRVRATITLLVAATAAGAWLAVSPRGAGTLHASRIEAGGPERPSPVLEQGPAFDVDRLWPKPLPNGWILGSVTGVAVDRRDHVWIVHRGADSMTARTEIGLFTDPPTAEACCRPAPPVLEFDSDGTLLGHWGGSGDGYAWPITPGGIAVDGEGSVWITAAGWPEPPSAGRGGRGGAAGAPPARARPHDAHLLKFSPTGRFLQQIGKPGASEGNASRTTLNRPAHLAFDASAGELFVADGYGHRRIVVLDVRTGSYKRHWGAYGAAPADEAPPPYDPAAPPAKQFRAVTCVAIAQDGLVYVCDRPSNRLQVFRKDGTFVKEAIINRATLDHGAVWNVAFSADPAQQLLFVADGQNHAVTVLNRSTLEPAGRIGAGGRWPGHFFAVGSVAVDSRGNLYTGEMFEGKRVQKFVRRP